MIKTISKTWVETEFCIETCIKITEGFPKLTQSTSTYFLKKNNFFFKLLFMKFMKF